MRSGPRVVAASAVLALGSLLLAACSDNSDISGSGGSGGSDAVAYRSEFGPITVVQGRDDNGLLPRYAAMWNAAHPKEKVTFKEQSTQPDQQLEDLLQHFQQQLPDYDVVSTDVVWTQQLASQGYLQPLTAAYRISDAGILPAALDTTKYRGVQYAAPASTDAQILYYRKDWLGSNPVPRTYRDMFRLCSIATRHHAGCYAGQFAKTESLTGSFSEAVGSAGGTVVDGAGRPTLGTPQAKAGLTTLVDAFKDGDIPKAAIDYQEEQGRLAFEAGKLMFLTNWPYMYSLATTEPASFAAQHKDALGIAPFPGRSSLGGRNWAISSFSTHKGTALKFLEWFETTPIQALATEKGSTAPVRGSLYEDRSLTGQLPYLRMLKRSLDDAVPPPASPHYQAVSAAVQKNAYAALRGTASVEQALSAISAAIERARD